MRGSASKKFATVQDGITESNAHSNQMLCAEKYMACKPTSKHRHFPMARVCAHWVTFPVLLGSSGAKDLGIIQEIVT